MNKAASTSTGRLPRVLVIDDDSTHRKMMELIAEHIGIVPEIVSNCREAVAAVSAADFDIILMDWRMPDIDGQGCTEQLRKIESSKHTPIVAVTALAMTGDREACLEAGVNDYLPKPFTIDELKQMISKWVKVGSDGSAKT